MASEVLVFPLVPGVNLHVSSLYVSMRSPLSLLSSIVISIVDTLTSSRREYYIFSGPRAGLFSVEIQKKSLAINNFSDQ